MSKGTIEFKHKEYLKKFSNCENKIQDLTDEIKELEKKKSKCINISEVLIIEKQINDKNKLIELNDNKNDEINYFLNVVPIINKYMDINEMDKDNETTELNFVTIKKGKERGNLYSEFINKIENEVNIDNSKTNTYLCNDCNIPKVISSINSSMICPECGYSDTYFDSGINTLSYEQEINSESTMIYSYKKMHHFNEWLAQFQAKESTEIPQKLLNELLNEFHKIKIKNTKEITKTKVKQFLKKLKYNKFYEHVTHITNLLSGNDPPSMNPEQEEQMRNMFRTIQNPFEKHKPENRSNFLSYSYCLYKFCELLGYDHLLCNFPLLKSREKLHQQDIIWKKICEELNWQYISTI